MVKSKIKLKTKRKYIYNFYITKKNSLALILANLF